MYKSLFIIFIFSSIFTKSEKSVIFTIISSLTKSLFGKKKVETAAENEEESEAEETAEVEAVDEPVEATDEKTADEDQEKSDASDESENAEN